MDAVEVESLVAEDLRGGTVNEYLDGLSKYDQTIVGVVELRARSW